MLEEVTQTRAQAASSFLFLSIHAFTFSSFFASIAANECMTNGFSLSSFSSVPFFKMRQLAWGSEARCAVKERGTA